MANILDGVFNASAEAMEIIKAPELTRDVYVRFGQLIEQAQHQQMGKDEFVKRAEAIAPEVGEAAKKLASSKMGYAVACLMIFWCFMRRWSLCPTRHLWRAEAVRGAERAWSFETVLE